MLNGQNNTVTDSLKEKLLIVHEQLCQVYHCPIRYFHDLDPLSELISAMLSHRTRNADSAAAFRALRKQFPDWQALLDAPLREVETCISMVTWPEQKAPRIQSALRLIQEQNGELSLDFLQGLSVPDARAWLEKIPGIGPKTSAAVLAFSNLRGKALPVDSHHHRVAQRLGLIPDKLAVGPAHALLENMLPPDWNAQQVYDHHEILMLHGQKCCYFQAPSCHRCRVLNLCPFGQAKQKARTHKGLHSS